MSVARNCTIPGLLFNAKYGFLDGRLRGYIDDLLSETDYSILAECPTLDDVVSYLNTPEQTRLSRYGVSHAHPSVLIERCLNSFVSEFNSLRSLPSLPGTRTFIDFFELLDLWIHD